ncbi:MAG: hypothetical protein KGL39_32110 [Patescibacteria group bacterium]|nr:hypothetical protein [Patescibacteria group bacterium]
MIKPLFRMGAALVTFAACSFFVAAFAALGFATFLLTFPLVWGSPTRRRVSASVDLVGSVLRLISTLPTGQMQRQAMLAARAAVETIPEDDA